MMCEDEYINKIKAMMMNLYQAIRVLSYSSLTLGYKDVAMKELAGSLRQANMFQPLLPNSLRRVQMIPPSCCTVDESLLVIRSRLLVKNENLP
jgi:hypothetical protein